MKQQIFVPASIAMLLTPTGPATAHDIAVRVVIDN